MPAYYIVDPLGNLTAFPSGGGGSSFDPSTLAAGAVAWTAVSKSGSSLADLATRSAADLSSGSLAVGRMPASGTWALSGGLTLSGAPLSLTGQYRSYAYRNSSGQAIPNNTTTTLLWTDNLYDVGGVHSTVTNTDRFTVPVGGAGLWMLMVNCVLLTTTATRYILRVIKNGTTFLCGVDIPMGASALELSQIVNVVDVAADGDFYTFDIYQNTGGSVNTNFQFGGGFGIAIKLF